MILGISICYHFQISSWRKSAPYTFSIVIAWNFNVCVDILRNAVFVRYLTNLRIYRSQRVILYISICHQIQISHLRKSTTYTFWIGVSRNFNIYVNILRILRSSVLVIYILLIYIYTHQKEWYWVFQYAIIGVSKI